MINELNFIIWISFFTLLLVACVIFISISYKRKMNIETYLLAFILIICSISLFSITLIYIDYLQIKNKIEYLDNKYIKESNNSTIL